MKRPCSGGAGLALLDSPLDEMNDEMTTLTVTHKNGEYPILIGANLLDNGQNIRSFVAGNQVMIVTNETVSKLYLAKVHSQLTEFQCNTLVLPDGEAYKTLETMNKIIDALLAQHHHRDTTLIALGGGVVGDMTGFAAACYQRGVNFIQIPTTLLSQVDASIGGKTGVNHPLGKNLIGAFHQPQAVIIDINTLNTLPDREYRAGIAEIIKAALILDAEFFDYLETNMPALLARDPAVLMYSIKTACQIKRDVVMQDEKEHGVRALLNFGHTFGHAIENNLGYGQWLHGEAVAMGMILAADLSKQLNWLSAAETERIYAVIKQAGLPTQCPSTLKCAKLMSAMLDDKKVLANQLRLILLKAIGHAVITDEVGNETLTHFLDQHL